MRASIWRRLAWLRAWFPLRLAGVLLLATSAWVVFSFSSEEADHVLHPAGLVALILVALATVLTCVGAYRVRRAVQRLEGSVPENLETTRERVTGFRVPRLGAFVILEVKVDWVEPVGVSVTLDRAGDSFEETIVPKARGRSAQVVRRFTIDDLFGLTSISFDVSWPLPTRIVPAPATCSAELASSRAQGDTFSDSAGRPEGDLVEMRTYTHGDSMRHVLWKTFARTRRLLVRLPERALSPRPISIAFLLAGRGDEPSAGTARLFVEQGLLGPEFLFAADGATHPARSANEAVEQIIDSVAVRHDGGATLDGLAAQMDPTQLTACLFFAPPIDGPWRARLTSLVHRLSLSPTVIIGVDAVLDASAQPGGRLRKFLMEPPTDSVDDRALAQVGALKRALEADGLNVQLIHRSTGQVL